MLNIALPKGRMGEKTIQLFVDCGLAEWDSFDLGRTLMVVDPVREIRYFLVKPCDVGVYVSRGAADLGVVGKEVLLETNPDVYELLDLGFGRCEIAVAAKNGYQDNPLTTLRIATKYPQISRSHYRTKSRNIELIHLNGSIELAPILGLSDVIVDVVETGSTLDANDLCKIETITTSSARLIANQAHYKFKSQRIEEIVTKIKEASTK